MAAAEFLSDIFEGLNGASSSALRVRKRQESEGGIKAVAPIRHLVGGKDNRRVESSHLDDDDVVGDRERLLLIKQKRGGGKACQ